MAGTAEAVAVDSAGVAPQIDAKIFQSTRTVTEWIDRQDGSTKERFAEVVFQELLGSAYRAESPHAKESAGHSCITVCGFVQHCAKARDSPLAGWAFQESVAASLFNFYLKSHEKDSHRSLRLILDVIAILINSNPNPAVGHAIRDKIVDFLVSIIVSKSARPLAKPSLQALNILINKHVLTLDDIFARARGIAPSGSDEPGTWNFFMSRLLSWMDLQNLCPIVGKVAVQLYCSLREVSRSDPQDPMCCIGATDLRQWLQEAAAPNPQILEDVKHYILKPLFKFSRAASLELLELCNETGSVDDLGSEVLDTNLLLQLAVLEIGKKADLVNEPGDEGRPSSSSSAIVLQERVLQNLLTYPSHDVRSSAFSLLVFTQTSTRPLSCAVLELVKANLPGCYSEHDAKFRMDILGYSKDLIARVKSVIVVAKRALSRPSLSPGSLSKKRFGPEANLKSDEEANEILVRHEGFIQWLISFLKQELIPTASYQRHIAALKVAGFLLKVAQYAGVSSSEDVDKDIVALIAFDPEWARLIFDLIMDPFDDVREAAVTILGMYPQEIIHSPNKTNSTLWDSLIAFSTKAHVLSLTGRADYGNGAARTEGLLCRWSSTKQKRFDRVLVVLDRLESNLGHAERNLGHAAMEYPVHGLFSSLNYIWQVLVSRKDTDFDMESVRTIVERIVRAARRVWMAVRHVLCDDSPEGHLPEELEDQGLDTRDLLSYSFRSIHESRLIRKLTSTSNLLRSLAATLSINSKEGVPYPTVAIFEDIGNLTFEQLSSLRHRGAFSTVAYTFTTCCQITQSLGHVFPDVSAFNELLQSWYKGTLACIMNQASTTRRSGGIPALMTGILAANSDSPSMKEIFETLGDIAKRPALVAETDGSNLPQVHALNCLKDVFKSSLLCKRADVYLTSTLQLAALSIKSEVWAIRNCGLMLFRSLVDVLISIKDNKNAMELGFDGTVQISYSRYPALPSVLLDLLRSGDQILDSGSHNAGAEAVFPVMDIIRRAGPPDEHREDLYRRVCSHLGSHLWHVREIAARTLCSFLLRIDWVSEVERLVLESSNSTNQLHGSLLVLKFILERKAGLGDAKFIEDAKKMQLKIHNLAREHQAFRKCPEIRALRFEIQSFLWKINPPRGLNGTEQDLENMWPDLSLSASLDLQGALRMIHDLIATKNLDLPAAWEAVHGKAYSPPLCSLLVEACTGAQDAHARAQALTSLTTLLNKGLDNGKLSELPPDEDLARLWTVIQKGGINPTLSWVTLEASGQLMAIITRRALDQIETLEAQLRGWSDMISDALDADNSFDTRLAAATALKTFGVAVGPHLSHPAFLPFLSSLYTALNDDDYDVRDLAATATISILGRPVAAFEAAEALVRLPQFRQLSAFRWQVVRRMVAGSPNATPDGWTSAETQLRKAMRIDDSLFAVEEQNLFIDEVRETRRWRQTFLDTMINSDDEPVQRLRSWAEAGVRYLTQLVETEDDGPPSWSSDQHVFAICARILLCCTALARFSSADTIVGLLHEFQIIASRKNFHGSLLSMSRVEDMSKPAVADR